MDSGLETYQIEQHPVGDATDTTTGIGNHHCHHDCDKEGNILRVPSDRGGAASETLIDKPRHMINQRQQPPSPSAMIQASACSQQPRAAASSEVSLIIRRQSNK